MTGPLDGLTVVDATWGMPGAVATLLLADYGARVVKLERPGRLGPSASVNRRSWDRGKWSVELDVAAPENADLVSALLQRADVFVESFGPGRAEELGLGYAQLQPSCPALVHCSISGYGLDDTPWRDRPGLDALVAARMGFMAEQPGHRKGPVFLGHPSIGYVTGFLTVIGALAALRARRSTGRGQLVDVSLLDGVLAQSPMNWWWNERGESYLQPEDEGVFGHRRTMMEMFRCKDGKYLMVHTGGDGAFKATLDILGLGDNVRSITGVREASVPLDDDEYIAARELAPKAWLQRPRDEWIGLLQQADVAVVPVLPPGEVLDHEQVRFNAVEIDLPDEDHGRLRQVGPTIRFSRTPAAMPSPAPRVGEHNDSLDELLARPVIASGQVADRPVRHALDGVRIVDFSQWFAGPYGAKLLSDLGADVIKVEAPAHDPMRWLPDPFEAATRGKRTITIDLKSPAALDVVHDLVRTADVVVHNFRPGKAEKMGLGYEQLAAINPRLVYCDQPGWGSRGPSRDLKSFAPLMSAMTGLMFEAAGEGNEPVRRARASEDYYAGLQGASAILMALHHRDTTGEGQYIESPQLHASLFCVTEQCLGADGHLVTDLRLDAQQTGYGPLYRLYRTSDGWVCVACIGDAAFARLRKALELEGTPNDESFGSEESRARNGPQLAAALEARFAGMTADAAAALLDRHGVPVEVARAEPGMRDFFWEQWALDSGRVFEHHHPEYGWIREVGLTVRLSETPGRDKGPAPLFGEHTRAVLAELGYSADRIAALMDGGPCVGPPGDH
jgi:crotonobetainyl-CoA:carnitine CoA-transferase CaiB-like acyl-CoA transferase